MLRFTAHRWSLLPWPGPSLPARACPMLRNQARSALPSGHTLSRSGVTDVFIITSRCDSVMSGQEVRVNYSKLTWHWQILHKIWTWGCSAVYNIIIYPHTYPLPSHQIFFLRSILKAQLQFCTQWKDFVASANCTRSNLKHWMVEKNFPQPAWQTDDRS